MSSDCCNTYLVYDERSGDDICVQCGRANRCLFATHIPNKKENNQIREHIRVKELRDICINANIPDPLIEEAVILLKQEKLKTRITAAQSLHKVFQLHGVPRSYKELSNLFFLLPTQIANYDSVSETKPSHLAERVLHDLDITRLPLVEKVAKKADALFERELNSVSPQSALAVSIALLHPELSMIQISKKCHITKQTLHKHYKAISAQLKSEKSLKGLESLGEVISHTELSR